jgi:hypothetical protein
VRRPAFFAKANDEECRDFCERNPCVWLDGRTAQCLRDAESERPESYCGRHALFLEKQCAHCHGEDGTGGVNLTRRVLDAKRIHFYRRRAREERHRMPAWREVLSDQEIWQATAYVLSISRPAH